MTASQAHGAREGRGIALPAIVLGAGLGGFFDGILLHQLLQWRETMWDGIFHAVTWLAVLLGLGLLYSRVTAGPSDRRALWGWVLVGWGLFNLVEGLVDHQILGIHHVRGGPGQSWWDLGYLALGALLVAVGWLLRRGARR
ncbi:DUF2243 domain-containing protein [Dactylosporangium sp. NPDC051485]|uniref:DUF2243 domain-containing protein n=1 Tax=Dactylosporangium sp. NPDC051485 TaxID=3154846 RepID=UPI003434081C